MQIYSRKVHITGYNLYNFDAKQTKKKKHDIYFDLVGKSRGENICLI